MINFSNIKYLNFNQQSETVPTNSPSPKRQVKYAVLTKNDAKTKDKIAINLIKIFKDGPEVSFNGSPTVSPTTAALCSSDPFLTETSLTFNYPLSMYFLALSHAPPVFDIEIAI
jgi:hypothetical protein